MTTSERLAALKMFQAREDSGWRETVLLATLIIALPTAAYVYIAERFGFLLPRLNFDLPLIYIGAVLLAKWNRKVATVLTITGTAIVIGIQILFGLGVIYIDDPALVREYLAFIAVWPWGLISFWLAVGATALIALFFLLRRIPIEKARLGPIIAYFLLILALDLAGRFAAGHALIGRNLVTSSASRTIQLVNALRTKPRFQVLPIEQPMMREELSSQTPLPRTILSVSVEAYGMAKDPAFNAAVLAPLQRLVGDRYRMTVTSHASKGPTLSGEMRELCGQRTIGTPTRADAVALSKDCAPAFLKAQGYRGIALHGNSGLFYNRYQLYPALGFDRTYFLKDLRSGPEPASLCRRRAFEGVCDEEVIDVALGFLGNGERRYAHIMTLDTHFPLGSYLPEDQACGRVAGLKDDDLCLYSNQFAEMLALIGRKLAATASPPEVVYIYGDHPPPYVVEKQRNFFYRDRVPFVVLKLASPTGSAAT